MLPKSISYRLIVGLGAVALAVLLFAVGSAPMPAGKPRPNWVPRPATRSSDTRR